MNFKGEIFKIEGEDRLNRHSHIGELWPEPKYWQWWNPFNWKIRYYCSVCKKWV